MSAGVRVPPGLPAPLLVTACTLADAICIVTKPMQPLLVARLSSAAISAVARVACKTCGACLRGIAGTPKGTPVPNDQRARVPSV